MRVMRWLGVLWLAGTALGWAAIWGFAPLALPAAGMLAFGAVGYVTIIGACAWFGSEGLPGPRALWIAGVLILPGVCAWATFSGY